MCRQGQGAPFGKHSRFHWIGIWPPGPSARRRDGEDLIRNAPEPSLRRQSPRHAARSALSRTLPHPFPQGTPGGGACTALDHRHPGHHEHRQRADQQSLSGDVSQALRRAVPPACLSRRGRGHFPRGKQRGDSDDPVPDDAGILRAAHPVRGGGHGLPPVDSSGK